MFLPVDAKVVANGANLPKNRRPMYLLILMAKDDF